MKAAIINYGMGNLSSVRRIFEDIGTGGMAHLNHGNWIPIHGA